MKLSLSSCATNRYVKNGTLTQTEAFSLIRSCGFSDTDLDIPAALLEGDLRENAERVRDQLQQAGLTPSMAHAPDAYGIHLGADGAAEVYRQTLKFCQYAGVPRVVMHPIAQSGTRSTTFLAINRKLFSETVGATEETGVELLIENIGNYADPFFLWNGKALRELIESVNHPMCGACWDVGHANHFLPKDCDQYESVTALGDRLKALHVHDNCGYFEDPRLHYRIDMHTFPFASGKTSVNYDALLQGLRDIHYAGTFNFEVDAICASMREPFVYHGETVRTLEIMPPEIWQMFYRALYSMGRYMLGQYGLAEPEEKN